MLPLCNIEVNGLDKTIEYMEKIAAFKADGTSDDDKLAWMSEYKQSLKPQDQLRLFAETKTAAWLLDVENLLDELQATWQECLKFVDECVAMTWEEEQELIAKYKWIDPEGLIAADREKRLSEKAKEQA